WPLPLYPIARLHGRERTRGRNAERSHRFADGVLAQHGPERRAAVAAARESGAAGALELEITAPATRVDDLAEQEGPPVAELRHEMPELMARVREGDRLGSGRSRVPCEHREPVRPCQPAGIEAKLECERNVDPDQLRRRDGRRAPALEETLGQSCERVV